jgi:hypothetical protein
MPNNPRPKLNPVITGSSHRFTNSATSVNPAATAYVHDNQPHSGAVHQPSASVAISPSPGSRSIASAPARAGYDATGEFSAVVATAVASSSTAVTR